MAQALARAVLDARLIREHTLVQCVHVYRGDMASPQQKLVSCLGYGLRTARKLGQSAACQHLHLALVLVMDPSHCTPGQSHRHHRTISLSEARPEARAQTATVHCQTEEEVLTRPAFESIMATLKENYRTAMQRIEVQMAEQMTIIESLRDQAHTRQQYEHVSKALSSRSGVPGPLGHHVELDTHTDAAHQPVHEPCSDFGVHRLAALRERHERERRTLKEQRRAARLSQLGRPPTVQSG